MADDTFEPIGYVAVLEGLESFMANLGRMQAGVANFGQQSTAGMSQAASASQSGGQGIAEGANVAGQAFDWLTAKSVAMGMAVYNSVTQVIGDIKQLGEQAITSAARVNEVQQMVYLLGSKSGYTKEQVDDTVKSVKDLGIETGVAQTATIDFMKYNIKLADGLKLAREAQDAAAQAGTNSSEALQRMLWGISTGQTEILRTMQIQVNFEAAYQKEATTLGKAVSALSEVEKTQARVNAVMEAGTKIAGSYEIVQGMPGKVATQIIRHENEALLSAGQAFQGAYGAYLNMQIDFWDAINKAVSKGGALEPLLGRLGGLFAVIGDNARTAAGALAPTFLNALGSIGNTALDVAEKALGWGANVIAQFALGMAEGAAWALTGAMDVISSLLGGWLSPGSPPKVAPQLTVWGTAAMESWLAGFDQADFTALNSIESSLQSVFAALKAAGQQGLMTGADFDTLFAQVIAGAISAQDAMAQLGTSTALYGNSLNQLIQDQLALIPLQNALEAAQAVQVAAQQRSQAAQDALSAVQERASAAQDVLATINERVAAAQDVLTAAQERATAAQEALTKAQQDAQDKEQKAQGTLTTKLSEYNALARSGASKEALAAKLAEVKAADAASKTATTARQTADAALKAASRAGKTPEEVAAEAALKAAQAEAKAQEAVIKKANAEVKAAEAVVKRAATEEQMAQRAVAAASAQEAALQRQLKLHQQVVEQITKLIDAQAKAAADAKAAAEEPPEIKPVDMSKVINVDAWKKEMGDKLATIFKPLTDVWPKIQKIFTDLGFRWELFTLQVHAFWVKNVKPITDQIAIFLKPLTDWLATIDWGPFVETLGKIAGVLLVVGVIAGALYLAFLAVSFVIGLVILAFITVTGVITTFLGSALLPIVAIGAAIALLAVGWSKNWLGIKVTLTNAWNTISGKFEELKTWLEVNIPKAIQAAKDKFTDIGNWFSNIGPNATKTFTDAITNVHKWIGNVKDKFNELIAQACKPFTDFWNGPLTTAINGVKNIFGGPLRTALDWVNTAFANIKAFMDEHWMPMIRSLNGLLDSLGGNLLRIAGEVIENQVMPRLRTLWNHIVTALQPAFDGINAVVAIMVGIWNRDVVGAAIAIRDKFNDVTVSVRDGLHQAMSKLNDWWVGTFMPGLTTLRNKLAADLQPAIDGVTRAWDRTTTSVTSGVHVATSNLHTWWTGTFIPGLETLRAKLANDVQPAIDSVTTAWNNVTKSVRDGVQATIDRFLAWWESSVSGPINRWIGPEGVLGKLAKAWDWITTAVDNVRKAIETAQKALDNFHIPKAIEGHSPPPLADWFSAIADQAHRLGAIELPAMHAALNIEPASLQALQVAAAPRVAAGNVMRAGGTNTLVFQTTINGRMDEAVFYQRVQDAVVKALR